VTASLHSSRSSRSCVAVTVCHSLFSPSFPSYRPETYLADAVHSVNYASPLQLFCLFKGGIASDGFAAWGEDSSVFLSHCRTFFNTESRKSEGLNNSSQHLAPRVVTFFLRVRMWGGIDFFVSLEALMTASIPSDVLPDRATASTPVQPQRSDDFSHFPGNPMVRRLEFSAERRLTPMFVYPNATLFLQVLCSTGNRVHLMTPWSKDDTTTILKSSEWVSFLKDARRIALVPGTSQFSFASLGIDPDAYVRTVLVVDDASRWGGVTALQLIEVQHSRDGVAAFHSMELLYALSRCILLSEWLLRYPSSCIASCVALCNTTLFSYCRFFFQGSVVDTNLMLLVTFHGGRVAKTEEEATHVVVLPPPPASEPSSASSSSGSSSSDDDDDDDSLESGSSGGSNDVMSAVDSSDAEEIREDKEEVKTSTGAAAVVENVATERPPEAPPPDAQGGPTVPQAPPPSSTGQVRTTARVTTAVTVSLAPSSSTSSSLLTVTPAWIYRCIRALRVVPLDEESERDSTSATLPVKDEEEGNTRDDGSATEAANRRAEAARKTKLLLCCLLPPSDARPLLWTTFQSIARQHHYSTACFCPRSEAGSTTAVDSPLSLTAISVMEVLTGTSLKDVVEVRLLPVTPAATTKSAGHTSLSSARSRAVAVTRDNVSTLRVSSATAELSRVALNRRERRRDKDAVFAHLQLIATQFLYSYEFVQRRRAQEARKVDGTQTGGVTRASAGVTTENVATTACDEADVETATSADRMSPPSTAAATAAAEATGSAEEKEWRHHLRNVEGRLLSRHEQQQGQQSSAEGNEDVRERDKATGKDEEGSCDRTTASPAAQGASLFRPPPLPSQPQPPAPGGTSIFTSAPFLPTVVANAVSPFNPLRPLSTVPLSSEARYMSCFIPTTALTTEQQDEFFAELRSFPIFSSPELGNNVVRLPDGAKCEFASHKAAEDFHRIDYVEFFSLHLPIYPYFEETTDRPEEASSSPLLTAQQPQQEMGFPLRPVPSAFGTAQQAQSLWTQPETTPESTRQSWPKPPASPSLAYVADTVGSRRGTSDVRRPENITTVPPYRTNANDMDAALLRREPREVVRTSGRRSSEKRRRLEERSLDDGRASRGSARDATWKEGPGDLRIRHRMRDGFSHREDRRERHTVTTGGSSSSGTNGGNRSRRADERARFSMEGHSRSRHSYRSHRESRRRRSSSESTDD
jgi:hypothetical protein